MHARKAVTLIEILLLIIVFLLLILVMSNGVGNCNGDNLNARCMANLRGIGQAMYIYAQDDPQEFPSVGGIRSENDGLMRVFDPIDRVLMPPTTGGVPSPTVDMWVLLRHQNTVTEQFICPWTTDVPDPALWPQDYYDFLSPDNLSYAYQFQHDPDRGVLATYSAPNAPLMADSNPYIAGGVVADILFDRLSDDQGNSTNHRLRRRGQHVLYLDGHVELEPSPDVGIYGQAHPALGYFALDNIYTVFEDLPPIYVDPGSDAPTSNWCNPGGRSDACLVP